MTEQPLKYSIGIVALGGVGSATYRELCHIDKLKKIYLFTTDLDKGKARRREFVSRKRSRIKPVVGHYNQLAQELDNLDVIIMTAAKPGYLDKGPLATREDALQDNLPILIRTAQMIQGFKGHVIVTTNPVDIATYIMCSHSGIQPEYFTGLSHVDLARWRTFLWEVYEPKGLRADLLDEFRIVTVGPHSEKVVPIIVAFGGEKRFKGLPRQEFNSLGDISYDTLRKDVRDFWIEQYMLTGKGTEWSTAQSIAEVVEAIYYQDEMDEFDYVCNSVFINPKLVGVEGALNGQFFGWPHIFKGLKAVPLDFRVEDDFDRAEVVDGWHDLESNIMNLQRTDVFQKFVSPSVSIIEPAGYKEEEEETLPRIKYEPFDLETRVVAGCYQEVFTWDNLNNPNQREPKRFDEIKDKNGIHTFCVEDIDGKVFYLIGHDNGFLITDPLTQEVFSIKEDNERSVRSLALKQINNDLYLFAARGDRAFMVDMKKPKKVFREFEGFSGDISKILVENVRDIPYVFVAARGIFQFDINNPGEPIVYQTRDDSDYIIDLDVRGNRLYGCTEDRMFCWNTGVPSSVPWQSEDVPGNGISCFDIANNLWGNDYAFVGIVGPQVYRVNLTTGEVEEKDVYQKKEGNKKGTGQVEVARIGGKDCLLASDNNRYAPTRQAGITIWDVLRPDMPLAFLTTNLDHSIRGFKVVKKDGY